MDLLLDRTSHDLQIVGYDLALVEDIDLIRQRIKQRLLLVLGEWFLDTSIGLPWYQEIFKKSTSQERVKALLINQITQTEGVNKILDFQFSYNSSNRGLTVDFRVDTIGGIINVRFDR
jgi:hypothetical protein